MQEHPLLTVFAQLVGDFFGAAHFQNPAFEVLLRRVAQALLQGQVSTSVRDPFQLERIQHFNTQYLTADDRDLLRKILFDEEQRLPQQPQAIRVFLREMPTRATYLRSSIPAWARGAALLDSVGPLLNRDGRRFWIDVYPQLPTVTGVWPNGATRAALILAPDKPLGLKGPAIGLVAMEAGTIWIQAKLFSAEADEKLYCGLRIAAAELRFQVRATHSHGQLSMRSGNRATLSVRLQTPEVVGAADSPYGIDARNAAFKMPEAFELTFTQNTASLNQVAEAAWFVYGDEKRFEWRQGQASFNHLLSAISIPMGAETAEFTVQATQSPLFGPANTAKIAEAAWLLTAAELGITLPAEGVGQLSLRTEAGLTATCAGLLDADQANTAQLRLNNLWLCGAPGLLQVIALESATEYATQTLRLWQDPQARWNELQLRYAGQFPFVYQSYAAGTESVASITDCVGSLDRPVSADGTPFALRTKMSLCVRAYGAERDYLAIYDENVIRDNTAQPDVPVAAVVSPTFQSQAIALNNALLTVSPVNNFLLSGELPPQANTFTEASLLYAFALVGYLPTLPDPYAAHTGVFKWMQAQQQGNNGFYFLSNVQRLLVASMHWLAAEAPGARFIFGDLEAALANQPIRLNPLQNLGLALSEEENTRTLRGEKAAMRRQLQAGTDQNRQVWTGEYDVNISVTDDPRYQNHHFFSLLDVSTAADWMGVNLGFMDERFMFDRTFEVLPDQNPLSADGMDVVATGRLVRLFTVPQISWEPVTNTTPPFNVVNDPPEGLLTFKDDGPPTLIGNTGGTAVPIAPLPLAKYVAENYHNKPDFKAWSFFSLPFGMLGIGRYNQTLKIGATPERAGATIELLQETFGGGIATALQISTKGYLHPQGNRNFEGMTQQLYNLHDPNGADLNQSILSATVTEIFNGEFGPTNGQLRQRGVPVERYDFSGYGANIFSHWLNPDARIAQTSQAKFDVWRGRTAHEVIQVRSLVYPWGIKVVRTITLFRNSAGLVYRIDSGWRAESDGVYNFRTVVKDKANAEQLETNGYAFHPGIVKGVFNVRNIVESEDLGPFDRSWSKSTGYFLDENDGLAFKIRNPPPALNNTFERPTTALPVRMVAVYFDADVQIDGVTQGAVNGKVPSKRMVGYLQLAPKGIVISPELFRDLLLFQNGLGGQVDCLVDIGGSGQTMRLSRVEVQPSVEAGKIVFVTAAKGSPVLPKDGSWSVVAHQKAAGNVVPISNNAVPLIQRGLQQFDANNAPIPWNNPNPLELANPGDLFNLNLEDRATQYAFLQNTDTQKVLFRNPWFEQGKALLQSSRPDLADAYRLLDSKGIFPKLNGLPRIDLNDFDLNIREKGYQLLHKLDPEKALEQVLPPGPVYFINEKEIKIYVEYAKKSIEGNHLGNGMLQFGLDCDALEKKWTNKLNDITVVVDLLDMKRLFLLRGKFDTEKGKSPSFISPELEFGPPLQAIYDILQILAMLNGENYAGALQKGLKIAMSNSPNNWEYKFQADKEIPVLKFPPPALDSPVAPLRLECYLKLGCYFNVGMPLPPSGLPTPSGGAFVEFGAKLSVMCLSVAAATVYAVGTCALRLSADTVRGPGLALKMGFGIELMVGLPVIGNVSVYFACGVEISIDKREIVVGAFILFRGRAELIGGLVTIQIQIEASGKIRRELGSGRTDCIAQVTFSLDISIFLVINISFSKSFQENRQIA